MTTTANQAQRHARRAAFSLLEIILVLSVIAIAAAIVLPIVSALFSDYEIERAAERLQGRILNTRLRAITLGVPYVFVYVPETRQYLTAACEPHQSDPSSPSQTSGAFQTSSGDLVSNTYDAAQFELPDELRFLTTDASVANGTRSVDELPAGTGDAPPSSLLNSGALTSERAGLQMPSSRTAGILALSGLNLPGITQALVFYPDGTTDDATVRIAHANGRYVELTIRGLTGAVRSTRALSVAELLQSGRLSGGTTNVESVPGPRLPGRERAVGTAQEFLP